MNIITQNIENSIKNILKSICNMIFYNYSNDFSDALLHNFSSLKLQDIINKFVIKIYEIAIPVIDNFYANSLHRKNCFYMSSKRKRTIVLPFGELSFERTYYVDKKKKNGFFLIDYLFNFEEYFTYDKTVRAIIIDNSINTNVNNSSKRTDFLLGNYCEYLNNNKITKIPRQTIYNWLKMWHIPKVKYDYIENSGDTLYVMVDEKWLHEQIRLNTLTEEERAKKHHIMSKCFVAFTGFENENGRTKLLNRHVTLTSSNKPWQHFMEEIYNKYDYEKFKNIYLLSDSGSWILAGASELKLFKENKVIRNTCEFHVKQYINRFVRSEEKRQELLNAIYEEKNKNKFKKLADEIIEEAKNKEIKIKYKNYIVKHWRPILNMKNLPIGSSMESHISHCIASAMASRPKGYSRKSIEMYLKLQEYKVNEINIMDLYLTTYNKMPEDEFEYNKNEVSYSIFEHNTSIIPSKSSNNPMSIVLNNIAHRFNI